MNRKEKVALIKRLLPEFPGFKSKNSLMFLAPLHHTVKGIDLDSSGWDKRGFYVYYFFLPLCVPREDITFTRGARLRDEHNRDGWSMDDPDLFTRLCEAIRRDALPFLADLDSPIQVAEALRGVGSGDWNPHIRQDISYMLARGGEFDRALDELNSLIELLQGKEETWELEIAVQADSLRKAIIEDPKVAVEMLKAWERESLHNLGLEKFAITEG